MTCNRCVSTSETVAPTAGAAHLEGNWAGHRDHPQYCDDCRAFLRADGGCTKCEGGGETLALATAPEGQPKMRLSCGHTKATTVSPGSEEWCTECDDFATVEAPAPPVPAKSGASSLSEPWRGWSSRRMQLWQTLEDKAKSLGISDVKDDWTGYAPSAGKGDGKVYGGFYGEGKDGKWYSVVAYGPIEKAVIQEVKPYSSEANARSHYSTKSRSKLSGKYSKDWPCDGWGH